MTKEPFLATAAAIVVFGAATDASAAPTTYDIEWESIDSMSIPIPGGPTGNGFFTIDSDELAGAVTTITDPAKIIEFEATFTDVPGFGTVTFDLDDLESVLIKVNDDEDRIISASFSTTESATDPYLSESAFGQVVMVIGGDSINFRSTLVPEPGTLALLAAGAAGLPLLRRRRADRRRD